MRCVRLYIPWSLAVDVIRCAPCTPRHFAPEHMSRFHASARQVRCGDDDASGHAWIAFHRCVEAFSRTTGEPFCDVFERLALAHGFSRSASLPKRAKLVAAVAQLGEERAAWLEEHRRMVDERRALKRAGRREATADELRAREQRRNANVGRVPRVGYRGWRRLRNGALGDVVLEQSGLRAHLGRGWVFVTLPSTPGDHIDAESASSIRTAVGKARVPAFRIVLLTTDAQIDWWAERDPVGLVAPLRYLARLVYGQASLWVQYPSFEAAAPPGSLLDVLATAGWSLRVIPVHASSVDVS